MRDGHGINWGFGVASRCTSRCKSIQSISATRLYMCKRFMQNRDATGWLPCSDLEQPPSCHAKAETRRNASSRMRSVPILRISTSTALKLHGAGILTTFARPNERRHSLQPRYKLLHTEPTLSVDQLTFVDEVNTFACLLLQSGASTAASRLYTHREARRHCWIRLTLLLLWLFQTAIPSCS